MPTYPKGQKSFPNTKEHERKRTRQSRPLPPGSESHQKAELVISSVPETSSRKIGGGNPSSRAPAMLNLSPLLSPLPSGVTTEMNTTRQWDTRTQKMSPNVLLCHALNCFLQINSQETALQGQRVWAFTNQAKQIFCLAKLLTVGDRFDSICFACWIPELSWTPSRNKTWILTSSVLSHPPPRSRQSPLFALRKSGWMKSLKCTPTASQRDISLYCLVVIKKVMILKLKTLLMGKVSSKESIHSQLKTQENKTSLKDKTSFSPTAQSVHQHGIELLIIEKSLDFISLSNISGKKTKSV